MTDSLGVFEPLIIAKREVHKIYKKRATHNALTAIRQAQTKLQEVNRSCANRYWNKLCDDIQKATDVQSPEYSHKTQSEKGLPT